MFNNLIESSSHGNELRRRGSFFLFTTASYALLFLIAGIVSIYAYDARMEDQSLEIVTLLPPVSNPVMPEPTVERPSAPRDNDRDQPFDERRDLVAPVDHVTNPPETISTTPPDFPPVRDRVITIHSDRDFDSGAPGGSRVSGSGGTGSNTSPTQVITNVEPPPAPVVRTVPKTISKGPVTGLAKSLPKPPYTPMAIMLRLQGPVIVQVLIDESGRVVSARAISGHPILAKEAEKAALRALFSPTTLGDQAVKVSGTITYNFILPQ